MTSASRVIWNTLRTCVRAPASFRVPPAAVRSWCAATSAPSADESRKFTPRRSTTIEVFPSSCSEVSSLRSCGAVWMSMSPTSARTTSAPRLEMSMPNSTRSPLLSNPAFRCGQRSRTIRSAGRGRIRCTMVREGDSDGRVRGAAPVSAGGRHPAQLVHGLFDPATELGEALAAVDWSATPLGAAADGPTSLRNVVRLLLSSRFAMWMAWGPELTFLCNDAYRRDTLGKKFPWALGRRADEVWSEIWPDIGPRIESVIATGDATWDEDLLLFLERSGYQEETYHTFSYSPLTDDHGEIAGMLCVVSEETGRVIGERRMRIVRDLGTALAAASTVAEVNAAAGRELALDGLSVPFAMAYLFDAAREKAELAWTANVPPGHPIAPSRLPVGPDAVWPTAEVAAGRAQLGGDLSERFADVPTGKWAPPPHRALLLPFTQPGQRTPFGFLVSALNRHRMLDADYRGFIGLVAGQVAAALTRARAFEDERRRAEDLLELDRAKTTSFTNVSHELRTPLTLLLGPAADALADEREPLSPAQRARVDVIQRN